MTTTLQRPTWQEVVLSFAPPQRRTDRAKSQLSRLGLPLILLIQAVLTWRLQDITNDDEALYIDAGHAVIRHIIHGVPLADYGSYLSGAPNAYPVVAAAIDGVGGLALVRAFSLLCMLIATVCVHRSSRRLFSERAALFSAGAFALDGSVLFMGKLATYDASCLVLVAIAVMLAVTRKSLLTAFAIGGLLATAVATKYAGAIFIPFVVILVLLTGETASRRNLVRTALRSALAGVTAVALLAAAYKLWGSGIKEGLAFTTTGRSALEYRPFGSLLKSFTWDVGLLTVLAAGGLVLAVHTRAWRVTLVILVCIGAGLALPASQVRIHEFVSLDKHTAFSALFLSLPAGAAVEWAVSGKGRVRVGVLVLVWFLLVGGLWRSKTQYYWPSSVLKTVTFIQHHPVPGKYIGLDGDTETYYTHAPGVDWGTSSDAYSLFGQTHEAIRATLEKDEYAGIVYRTGAIGTVTSSQLTEWLQADPDYRLTATFRVDRLHSHWFWYVWQLRAAAPAGSR